MVSRLETTSVIVAGFRLGAAPVVEQKCRANFNKSAKIGHFAMQTADWYLRKADECAALAKVATMNEERARHYARAERYMQLAMDALNLPKQRRYRARTVLMPAAGGR